MRMKTLLLGSAAVFAFAAGSAQAADLSVAEPVDYVRVCDAFGSGYFYIPGTDTCLRIGGFVRFELQGASGDVPKWGVAPESGFSSHTWTHDADYKFFTRANFQIEARSQTDWGPLIGYMEFETDMDMKNGTYNSSPEVQEAFVSIGPLTAGLKQSAFDHGGGYTMSGLDDGYSDGTAITDNKLNQVQLAWAMNGFGIILAVEDQQARAQDWSATAADNPKWWNDNSASSAGSMPDLVAAVTMEAGSVAGKVSFLYSDSGSYTAFPNQPGPGPYAVTLEETWAVQGSVEVSDLFGGSDKAILVAGYIDDAVDGHITSVLASFRHYWMSNLYSGVTYRYDNYGGTYSGDDWTVAFDTRYNPVEDLTIGGQVIYNDASDSFAYKVRLQRDIN